MVDNKGNVTENEAQIVEVPVSTAVIVESITERGRQRGDARFRYVKTFSDKVEALLVFGAERLSSQYKSGDESKEARDLLKALQDGKPLTSHQRQLIELATVPAK